MNTAIIRPERFVLAVGILAIFCLAGHAPAATAKEVNKAVEKAKEYLYSTQKEGHWDADQPPSDKDLIRIDTPFRSSPVGPQYGGQTSIIVYALLTAGENPTDPRLAPAIAFLKKTNIVGTYALSLRLQVYSLLPQTPDIKTAIAKDAKALIEGIGHDDVNWMFFYHSPRLLTEKTMYDMSASNLAALGIWAAAESGYEVPSDVWRLIDAGWRREQKPTGEWGPHAPEERSDDRTGLTMPLFTSAGIATLYITRDYMGRTERHPPKSVREDTNIRQAMDCLISRWEEYERLSTISRYYCMFNIERVALASGRRFFGKVDWYDSGTEYLLKKQDPDGSFSNADKRINTSISSGTAFALIFLAHGRAPVAINKLEYGVAKGGSTTKPTTNAAIKPAARPTTRPVLFWEQRPRDAARFTKWLGKQVERKLSWQIVDLNHDPSYLHDAPILFITGKQTISFSAEDEAALRQFAEEGGLILANAENGNPEFSDSMKKLGSKLFPSYEFRELLPTHAIYTDGQFPYRDHKPELKLLGLSNGSRELMLLVSSGDISQSWERDLWKTKEDAFQVAANIFHYATDRNNPRERGDTYIITPDPAAITTRKIEVARLKYNSNWDPEPAGWRRLAASMRNDQKVDLVCKTVQLGNGELKGFTIAHLTGTTTLTLSDAAKEELKQFIAAGGTLIVDAAGGSGEFRDSIGNEIKKLAGIMDMLPAPLPASHPLYTVAGREIKEFTYRRAVRKLPGGSTNIPRLRGIEINGRTAIYYSEEDISTGLVGQHVGGIIGYSPQTAGEIMRNLLMSTGLNPTTNEVKKTPAGTP